MQSGGRGGAAGSGGSKGSKKVAVPRLDHLKAQAAALRIAATFSYVAPDPHSSSTLVSNVEHSEEAVASRRNENDKQGTDNTSIGNNSSTRKALARAAVSTKTLPLVTASTRRTSNSSSGLDFHSGLKRDASSGLMV
jgi:hypothetical protein